MMTEGNVPAAFRDCTRAALLASGIIGAALLLGFVVDHLTGIKLIGSIKQPLRGTLAAGLLLYGLWIAAPVIRTYQTADTGTAFAQFLASRLPMMSVRRAGSRFI